MRSVDYDKKSSKQFGEMYERMKFWIPTASENVEQIPQSVRTAIIDFEAEIRHHGAVTPPYGHRLVKPNGGLGRMPVDVGID